jgi:hypothetical protein
MPSIRNSVLKRELPATEMVDVPCGEEAFSARRLVSTTTCGVSRVSSIGLPPRCGSSWIRR